MAVSTHPQLEPATWRDELSIKIRSIDEEHRLLMTVLNRIIDCRGSPTQYSTADRALRDLFAYADYHFEHEEDLMTSYEYPGINEHKAQHLIFITKLRQMDRELTTGIASVDDLARFIMEWFVIHIQMFDMEMGVFLAERMRPERSPFEFETYRISV
ncbi:MAG: hemerythrin family protein [Rhodospirillaceae bacterium]